MDTLFETLKEALLSPYRKKYWSLEYLSQRKNLSRDHMKWLLRKDDSLLSVLKKDWKNLSEDQIEHLTKRFGWLKCKEPILELEGWNTVELPSELRFHLDTLMVSNTPLKALPSDLSVDRLSLRNTKVENLPDNLTLKELDISSTPLKKLPQNLSVDFLDIYDSPIETLPHDISLNIARFVGTQIHHLPDHLRLSILDIYAAPITQLPNNLNTGKLYLHETQITHLPADLCSETVHISDTPLKTLSSNMHIKQLFLDNTFVDTIPENSELKILHVHNTPLREISSNTENLDELYLYNTQVEHLSEGMILEKLAISETPLRRLPTTLKVRHLKLENPVLESFPLGFSCEHLELRYDNPKGIIVPDFPDDCSTKSISIYFDSSLFNDIDLSQFIKVPTHAKFIFQDFERTVELDFEECLAHQGALQILNAAKEISNILENDINHTEKSKKVLVAEVFKSIQKNGGLNYFQCLTHSYQSNNVQKNPTVPAQAVEGRTRCPSEAQSLKSPIPQNSKEINYTEPISFEL